MMDFIKRWVPPLMPSTLVVGSVLLFINHDYIYGVYQLVVGICGYIWWANRDK